MFNGDGEGVPGLAIDLFGDVAIVHANSAHILSRWREALGADLAQTRAVYVKLHPRSPGALSAATLRTLAPTQPAWGSQVDQVEVVEYAAHYAVRPPAGLSVGLFLDMRDVRDWVYRNAERRSVLNLFAYTCAFGVSATLGKAARVVNIDVSRASLDWGKDNYRLNHLMPEPRDFIYGDAFDWLGRFRRRATRFDMVIVDPPSFSSTPFSVTQDYPKLVDAAARVVEDAGILVAATNHAGTSDKRFESWLDAGLESAGRHAEVVHSWHEPEADFPAAPGHGTYLKVRALVLD